MLVLIIGILLIALAAWVVNTQFSLPPPVRMIANIVLLLILLFVVLAAFGVRLPVT